MSSILNRVRHKKKSWVGGSGVDFRIEGLNVKFLQNLALKEFDLFIYLHAFLLKTYQSLSI